MNILSNSIKDHIECPTSKSYANRALILASLKTEKVTLLDMPLAQDVKDMISVLISLGLDVEQVDRTVIIHNSFPECEEKHGQPITLNLGEGGTTVRFLYPLIALGKNRYNINLSGRMTERPMESLMENLRELGGDVSRSSIQGPIKTSGLVEIDCSKTTQFASALMHLCLKYPIEIDCQNIMASQKYLDMTDKMLEVFKEKSSYVIPPDYSCAGYMIAFALLNKDIYLNNVYEEDFYQADSKMLEVVKSIGGKFSFSEKGLFIQKLKNTLSGIEIDGSECIDLVPTLMFIASFLPYETKLKNIESLQYKECNRLEEMIRILDFFDVKYSYRKEQDVFTISKSSPKASSNELEVEDDHRMVMVASLFFKMLGGGKVTPTHSVNKSFPQFFEIFK